jgi:type VI secretion system secreted protein VgrG
MAVGYGDADGGRYGLDIEKDKYEYVGANSHLTVASNYNKKVGGTESLTAANLQQKMDMNWAAESGMNIHIKAGMCLVLEAGMQISLKVGGNFVDISLAGVAINGMPAVLINSGGAPGAGPGAKPTAPEEPADLPPADPTLADNAKSGQKSAP